MTRSGAVNERTAPRIGLDLLCLQGERTGMAWQAWWLARWLPEVAPDLNFVFYLPPDVAVPGVEAPGGAPSGFDTSGRADSPAPDCDATGRALRSQGWQGFRTVASQPGARRPIGPGASGNAPSRPLPPNVEIVRVDSGTNRGTRVVGEQWHLPRAVKRSRPDLLHTIAYGPPVLYRGRKILTIHDLGFRLFPETVPPKYRAYWNWAYGPAARACRHVIAVSESTRADVVRLLDRDPATVSVVHCGVDPAYSPAPADAADDAAARAARIAAQFGISGPYVLNVGTIQPRKDFATLVRTFARIHADAPGMTLVVAGGEGWGYGDPMQIARDAGVAGQVRLLNYAPIEAMPDLYRSAALFLFTSMYEGFGLPPLEAMASGTPVVTTSSSSIPEVVGDAAFTAPVGDSEALAAQALRLLREPSLRDAMIRRGLERSRLFSWRTTAEKTAEVYRAVLR